jgi:hypothetical protein
MIDELPRGGIEFELHPPAVSSESPAPNLAANLGVGGQNSVRRRINQLRHISFSAVPVFFRQNGGVTRYNFATSPLNIGHHFSNICAIC